MQRGLMSHNLYFFDPLGAAFSTWRKVINDSSLFNFDMIIYGLS